ncbi:MAG: oligosaccharide flippase family protein [Bacteroidota bacterium]
MGQIKRQSIKGTIYSYIGTVIGFITAGLLFPRFLTTERIGLLSLLASYATLFAVFGNLGFNSVVIRLFPYFRDESRQHHGFFFLIAAVSAVGYLLSILVFLLLKPMIIRDSIEQSPLFVEYLWLVPVLTLFLLFYSIYDSYNRALFNATYGTFLTEVFQRFSILVILILFIAGFTSFHWFTLLYVAVLCLPGLLIFYPLIVKKQVFFKPQFNFIDRNLKKEIVNVSLFGIIIGYSNIIIQRVDTIMINSMIDLSATGIYSISLLFGGIVSLPSRSLNRISTSVISDAWKINDTDTIRSVYFKSCLNQTIIGTLVFAGIWANINNVFRILPSEFESGEYVILFFGLSAVITMMAGVSSSIINLSKEYRYNTYFTFSFGILVILTNLALIPVLGITGAALAALISNFIYHLMQGIFLFIRFRLFPYDFRILIVLLIAAITYLLSLLLPELPNFIADIIVRSTLMTIVFGTLILLLKVSADVNDVTKKVFYRLKSLIIRK